MKHKILLILSIAITALSACSKDPIILQEQQEVSDLKEVRTTYSIDFKYSPSFRASHCYHVYEYITIYEYDSEGYCVSSKMKGVNHEEPLSDRQTLKFKADPRATRITIQYCFSAAYRSNGVYDEYEEDWWLPQVVTLTLGGNTHVCLEVEGIDEEPSL